MHVRVRTAWLKNLDYHTSGEMQQHPAQNVSVILGESKEQAKKDIYQSGSLSTYEQPLLRCMHVGTWHMKHPTPLFNPAIR
jgi:hypothetical protein